MQADVARGAQIMEILEATGPSNGDELRSDVRGKLVSAIDAALGGRRIAFYVSTPITTGPRLLAWRRSAGTSELPGSDAFEAASRAVMTQNISAVRELVQKVQSELGEPVIDPTRLGKIGGWTQSDYHQFWVVIIGRFVHTIVFNDGWPYSSGCVLEFAAAVSQNLRILDSHLDPISPGDGLEACRNARDELITVDLNTGAHDEAVCLIAEAINGKAST